MHILPGSEIVVHVLIATFQRLFEGLEAKDLDLIQDCLCEKIMDPKTSGKYLNCLLSLLVSTIEIDNAQKVSGDCGSVFSTYSFSSYHDCFFYLPLRI